MPPLETRLPLFVSCPGGLEAEKDAIFEVCTTINRIRGRREGFFIEPIDWKTSTRPAAGDEPQALINEQIGSEYSIYVGILGSRFGTQTKKYGSGTEEEFEIAMTRLRAGENLEILLYFKDPKFCEGEIDAAQLLKVQEFRKRMIKEASILFRDFETVEEFRLEALEHISEAVSNIVSKKMPNIVDQSFSTNEPTSNKNDIPLDPLSNLNAILEQDEPDEGFVDLIDIATDELDLMNQETAKLSNAVLLLSDGITKTTAEVQKLSKLPLQQQRTAAKRVINRLNTYMSSYVSTAAQILPLMHEHGTASVDNISRAVIMMGGPEAISEADKRTMLGAIEQMQTAMSSSVEPLTSFQEAIRKWPPMTRESNRAKRQVLAVNTDIEAFLNMLIKRLKKLRHSLETD